MTDDKGLDNIDRKLVDQEPSVPLCEMGRLPVSMLPGGLDALREEAILENLYKWVNGTVIHYYLIPSDDATDDQKAVVRKAFKEWEALEIGLRFSEVSKPQDAEIRIAFDYAARRSSSHIGTYNLKIKYPEPTMRFGWDLTTPWGNATARHEIGHALGLKHEHQNPNAGIVWNEAAVIEYYKKNDDWDEATIRYNVINKLRPGDITATKWDVTSIMHYPIAAGLIIEPNEYKSKSTPKNISFSKHDIEFIRSIYPKKVAAPQTLKPMSLVSLPVESGQQADLILEPNGTRDYEIRTVGKSDARMVAFEMRDSDPHYLAADDDSAEERNAALTLRLIDDRKYILRIRLHSAYGGEGFGVMMV
jgi:hypothetical protein